MLSVTLAACQTSSTATTVKTICEPWRPIRYNSHNAKSPRHAGPDLARKLAVHNRTGENLSCW